jgi:ABC-type enterochelin transport system permease subunit
MTYFMVVVAFRTILSSQISEQMQWDLYWILVGMVVVLLFDGLVNKVRRLIDANESA